MNDSIEEVMLTYSKIYNEFAKFAEYFLEKEINKSPLNINDKDNILITENQEYNRLNSDFILIGNNTDVIEEDTETYYGTQEDDDPTKEKIYLNVTNY